MATNGDFLLATDGDFLMAMDTRRCARRTPPLCQQLRHVRDQIGGSQARPWSPRRATIRDRSDNELLSLLIAGGRAHNADFDAPETGLIAVGIARSDADIIPQLRRGESHVHPLRAAQRAVGRPLCFTDNLYAARSGHQLAQYRLRLHPRELCPQA